MIFYSKTNVKKLINYYIDINYKSSKMHYSGAVILITSIIHLSLA